MIDGIKNIQLGKNVYIHDNAFLLVQPLTGEEHCELIMGDNSHLNFGAHIVATKRIKIGNNCSCSPYVYIADNSHGYEDVNTPPKYQKIRQLREVEIGDDTWLGLLMHLKFWPSIEAILLEMKWQRPLKLYE